MNLKTPQSLKIEHEELHAELEKAKLAGGATAKAAREVERALHPHFIKEEEYALPPLALLPLLAAGRTSPDMSEAAGMAGRLRNELGQMLQEHKQIALALGVLTEAAKRESKEEFVHFAEKLMLHARTEEEVLYPASILVGEHLKLMLK